MRIRFQPQTSLKPWRRKKIMFTPKKGMFTQDNVSLEDDVLLKKRGKEK